MSAFCHPAWPEIVQRVTDDRDDEMVAAGWVPLLDPKQKKRLKAIEAEVAAKADLDQLERELKPRK